MQGRLENLLGALVTSVGDDLRVVTEAAAGHGASGPAALATLLRRPGQSVETLRARLGLSHSATVRVVDRLVADGLAVRRPARDVRSVAVSLTAKGRRRALRVHQRRRSALSRAVAGLSAGEERELERLLDRLLRTQALLHEDPRSICRLCEVQVCPLRRCPVPAGR